MPGRGTARGGRVGVGLALLGLVAILGGTFGAGVFVGRHWERVQVTVGLVKPRAESAATPGTAVASASRERRHVPARAAGTPAVRELPNLTFYQELTAPLDRSSHAGDRGPARSTAPASAPAATPPAPAPPAPAEPPAVALPPRVEPPAAPVERKASERADPRDVADDGGRGDAFTVQVGAYGSRAAADALRAALAGRGFAAGVSTVETAAGRRYRVRVGTYPTREAATAVVSRIVAEAKIGAIVMRAGGAP